MLARLWWKDYRAFGPVWLILLGTAGLLQWFLLSVGSTEDVKTGGLTVTALAWAVLYAFATGAAAFAGERETKTLGFLDALPVGRWTLWLGKATFALVTTYGLSLLLAAIAALGTEKRDPMERYSYADMILVFGTLLFEAVAWSLLWSSLTKNALMAGVLGVLSVYVSAIVISVLPGMDHRLASNDLVGKDAAPARWLAALGALAVSSLVMAWRPRLPRRPSRAEPVTPPIAIRATSTGRSLIWQARREGWTTWLLVVVVATVAWVVPFLDLFADRVAGGMIVPAALLVLASLVSGVSVFGLENASGSRRFLVHHGVAAGTVWWRRVLVWAVAIASIFGLPVALLYAISVGRSGLVMADPDQTGLMFYLALLNGFAVGLLCGMAITRRITAVLVGVIVLVAILPPQIGAGLNGMVPTWSLLLVPTILVAASRAWASDWLLEREGFRPWLRFGAWLAGPSAVLVAAFVLYRAFGLPDVGPQFVAANLQPPAIPPAEDAALAYDRAIGLYQAHPGLYYADNSTRAPTVDFVIENGWNPKEDEIVAYWMGNGPAIDQARRASTLARGRFEDLTKLTVFTGSGRSLQDLEKLSQLLALDARERLSRNDVAGAWEDLQAQLRMASQLGADPTTVAWMQLAMRVHQRAVALAFDWLAAPGHSPAILNRALADLKSVPAPPNAAGTMRVESAIIERTLDRFDDEMVANAAFHSYGFRSTIGSVWYQRVVAAPWERQRARRVGRLLVARGIPDASVEPYQRGPNLALKSLQQSELERNWSVTRSLMSNFDWLIARLDRMTVDRRALEQAVAIEAWKLGHEGNYPQTLNELVPGILPGLPLDPFSGKPFGYVRSDGREVKLIYRSDGDLGLESRPTRAGQPLLYSVGPGQRDDGGRSFLPENRFTFGDYVFPIP